MKKTILGMLLLLSFSILLMGCNNDEQSKGKKETEVANSYAIKTSTPLETIESFVSIYYFDKGIYKDYQQLFIDKKAVQSEEEFTAYRQTNKPEAVFEKGTADSVDEVMTHMKLKEVDKDTSEVYWVKNPKQKGIEGATSYWILEKKGDQWLLN